MLVTERTESILNSATLPEGSKSFLVPDTHGCFDDEQRYITNIFKTAFGTQAAEATLKVAIDQKGERHIYEPSVMAKDGKIVIDWGGKTYPLPSNATFQSGSCSLVVEIAEVEYSLRVRVLPIKKEDAIGATQTAWASLELAKKSDYLSKAWAKGTIIDILAQAYPTICKLSEVIGQHKVIGFKMGTGMYPKYLLELSDKRVIRANTVLHEKLSGYVATGVEVSPGCPAQLTVGKTTSKTTSGFDIYPVTLVSHRNIDLPVFDFGGYSEPVETKEHLDTFHFSA